jgi:mannose-1-phosphate guanylyltransferase
LSRKKRAKQLLALDGKRTMLQQTVARLAPLARAKNFLVITNHDLRAAIRKQLPKLRPAQVLAEPVGRNTAPAIGLAAFLLQREDPEAVLGLFPADHVIGDEPRFRQVLARGIALAAAGENMVVMGIRPTRAESGYGYIEAGGESERGLFRVRRFTEKPSADLARQFLLAGNYFWNSGMFLWSARTLTAALHEHLPATAQILERIAADWGTRRFPAAFRRLYPRCENISADHAIAERRSAKGEHASNLYCLPADFGWSDLGSWAAFYEHQAARQRAAPGANLVQAAGHFTQDAAGNLIHAPGKFVAALGVSDLVVVETGDALLITTRERAQDVGKVVKHLDEKKRKDLV